MSGQGKTSFEVEWRIENIKSWLETRDDILYSPHFLAGSLKNTRWKLILAPNWQLGEKYISLSLQRDIEDDHPKSIHLNYELSFLASNGSSLKSKRCIKKFLPKTISHELYLKQDVILKEKSKALLSKGVLTIYCKLWKWAEISKEGQCSIQSEIGIKSIAQKASIDNYSPRSTVPVNFLLPSTDISRISLDVYVSDDEFIFERKHIESKSLSWYSCKLFALNSKGYKTEFDERINNTKPKTSNNAEKLQSISYDNFLFRYLPYGTLTLQLEITYDPGVVSECIEGKFKSDRKLPRRDGICKSDSEDNSSGWPDFNEGQSSDEDNFLDSQAIDEDECCSTVGMSYFPLTTLKEDLISLYNDNLFCDTKLRTGTDTFPAHRNVLCARSPVFKKMFTTDMKEKAGECINISDISSDTICRLLHFIYTDCTGDLEMQSAMDLYIASDKYDIASLKQCCSSFMKDNLCPSNVCEVLVLADMHQDKNLESAAQEYVLTNAKNVLNSDQWKLFMKKFSSLAAQVMYLKFTKD